MDVAILLLVLCRVQVDVGKVVIDADDVGCNCPRVGQNPLGVVGNTYGQDLVFGLEGLHSLGELLVVGEVVVDHTVRQVGNHILEVVPPGVVVRRDGVRAVLV